MKYKTPQRITQAIINLQAIKNDIQQENIYQSQSIIKDIDNLIRTIEVNSTVSRINLYMISNEIINSPESVQQHI